MSNASKSLFALFAACLAALICVCCACLVLLGGFSLMVDLFNHPIVALPTYSVQLPGQPTQAPGLPTQAPGLPTQAPGQPAQAPGHTAPLSAVVDEAQVNLERLEAEVVPVSDPVDLAQRFHGVIDPQRALQTPAETFYEGDVRSFWVTDNDTDETFQIEARLVYAGVHVYFWAQQGVKTDQGQVRKLIDAFDQKIYPTNREFFGSEWTPGVDADPRLFILYTRGLGDTVAGYFSSSDSYLPQVIEKSNGHEMFILNADNLSVNEEFAYGVLAHEFQHMIHWYRDRNEETWMNEGFSDLAMFINKYSIGGVDRAFIRDPDIQLTNWPNDGQSTLPHYGASFLFLNYFLDRFGETLTKALVAEQDNGMVSIDKVLTEARVADPETGRIITADDLFTDWTLASYLHDGDIGDGRYAYHNNPSAPQANPTETISMCDGAPADRTVSQYGVDYIRIRCKGDFTLRFSAPQLINVLPTRPYSGDYAFYSNRGDASDMTLTHDFDFTELSGPITFSYSTWYDLETSYDYLYLLASIDDGKTWEFIQTPSGTDENPVGNSYGWGYNSVSANGPDWIQESVDLSQYAGKQVQLRFEYITDAAVNGEGFLLDDVSIPQLNYTTDFEQDDGGWVAQGFVRIQPNIPQVFRLSLIYSGRNPRVEKLALPATNSLEAPISLGGDDREVVVVVSGVSPFTRQPAQYQFALPPR